MHRFYKKYILLGMNFIHLLSILLEVAVAVLGVMMATEKKKKYGYNIALTFAIYVFYDLASLYGLGIPAPTLYILFLVATLSILAGVWQIYKKK